MFESPLKAILKKAKKGFKGYPVATVAFYGPDADRATKVAVGIVLSEGAEPAALERWIVELGDVRTHPKIGKAVVEFVRARGVRSIAMTGGILGCPHEEGKDYPEGGECPSCPFWAGRDRFTGDRAH